MKNQIKNTVLAALFIIGASMLATAGGNGGVPIKSKRQLEYPSLPQTRKDTCFDIACKNIDLYWQKKGILNNPGWIKSNTANPLSGEGFKTADDLVNAIYEWMDEDDNAAVDLTLLPPSAHAVVVDSIFKEKKRFLFIICSWGKKFVIEVPRPVRQSKDEYGAYQISGCKVVGGDPKDAKYLYDEKTGGEHGPNSVTMYVSNLYTMIPADVVKKDTELYLKCLELGTPMPKDQVHPFTRMFVTRKPSTAFFSLGTMPAKYCPPRPANHRKVTKKEQETYEANYAKIKEYDKKSATESINKRLSTISNLQNNNP